MTERERVRDVEEALDGDREPDEESAESEEDGQQPRVRAGATYAENEGQGNGANCRYGYERVKNFRLGGRRGGGGHTEEAPADDAEEGRNAFLRAEVPDDAGDEND